MAFFINDATESHATHTRDTDYGDETIIHFANGASIRCAAYPNEVDYVRVCDDDSRELAYWVVDEFKEDFSDAMGAFLGLARQVSTFPTT